MKILVLALPVFALAACGEPADEPKRGADVMIAAGTEDGKPKFTATADGETGRVVVTTPAFNFDIDLPKIALDADEFNMGKVKLYPGSTVDSIKVDAVDGSQEQATVDVAFTAPASAATVRDWFAARFAENDMPVDVREAGLVGEGSEGESFVIALEDAAAGTSKGTIHITE